MVFGFLDKLFTFLNKGYVGALISTFGVVLSVYFYYKTKVISRLAFQGISTRLIGGKEAELPDNVSVYYQKNPSLHKTQVPRLSKTTIVLWNAGKTTFRGEDIVPTDRLRIEFESTSQVLFPKVILKTRDVNGFTLSECSSDPHIVYFSFDFLDPGDGVRIQILHTSNNNPKIFGTIRGLPKGLTNLGSLYDTERKQKSRKGMINSFFGKLPMDIIDPFILAFLLLSIFFITSGIFPDLYITLWPSLGKASQPETFLVPGKFNWRVIFGGIVLFILPGFYLWNVWRRFPQKLSE
jgi:hypothetical protein